MASASPSPAASPLFLREQEIRRGIELLHFGHAALIRAMKPVLDRHGLGRAHQRALYFIGRRPDISVADLLRLLHVTKQSLGRVLDDLTGSGLVAKGATEKDRRRTLLRLTERGEAVEQELFEAMRERLAGAYSAAGQGAVTGFWRVLESVLDADDQGAVPLMPKGRS